MRDIITRYELAELGLHGVEPGHTERVDWPDVEVAQARGVAAEATSFALAISLLGTGQLHFSQVRSELAERLGVDLEALDSNRRIVRVVTREPGTFVELLAGRETCPVHRPGRDSGTLYVDLSAGKCLLRLSPDRAIALAADPQGLGIQELMVPEEEARLEEPEAYGMARLAADTPARPAPEVVRLESAWIEQAMQGTDHWLADEVLSRVRNHGPYPHFVAGGMFARLLEPSPTPPATVLHHLESRAGEAFHLMFAAKADLSVAGLPRRWARAQREGTLRAVETQAVDAVRVLLERLRAFEDALGPDVDEWRSEWVEICHRRDDLEGVLALLQEAGAGKWLAHALEPVDRLGRDVLFHVPAAPFHADERMRRVRLGDPGAWWGTPDDLADFRASK